MVLSFEFVYKILLLSVLPFFNNKKVKGSNHICDIAVELFSTCDLAYTRYPALATAFMFPIPSLVHYIIRICCIRF